MPLQGKVWKPRDIAALLVDNGWVNVFNLPKMVATVMAESAAYEQAWHWNDPHEGGDGSTDWGLFQLNDGNKGGSAPDSNGNPQPGGQKSVNEVTLFRDKAWDPTRAVLIARDLYNGRGFQPWAAVANGSYKEFLGQADYGVMNMLRVYQGLAPI